MPVVVWCQNVCASGGVWIAMVPSVKFIAVRTHTVGGSVGVIATLTRFNRLLDYLKIDNETYKTGSLKDAGNPTRAAEEAERAYIQSIINGTAKEFYSRIAAARGKKVSPEAWVEIKTAAVFVGPDLVRVGLADAMTSKEEAYAKAKELSGSKSIYTRDELRKMSQVADERPHAALMLPAPRAEHGLGDVAALVEMVKEVRQGSTVRFEMLLPYQF
jgi:ClpP class serine protease